MWVCIALLFLSYLQYNSAKGDGLVACIPGTPARRACPGLLPARWNREPSHSMVVVLPEPPTSECPEHDHCRQNLPNGVRCKSASMTALKTDIVRKTPHGNSQQCCLPEVCARCPGWLARLSGLCDAASCCERRRA